MTEAKFFGARLEPEVLSLIDETAKDEETDKSTALRKLVILGRQKLREQQALTLYRDGKISLDRAAEIAGLTVSEMMSTAAHAGIKSEETFAEYNVGLQLLLKTGRKK